MKTEFKAKFLQYVSNRKKEEGFTLIELLVVIIIIGILAAIALPSFLNQANKAKQSEGKQYLSAVNKGQQAYYVENTAFAANISELGIGLKTQTSNFKYGAGKDGNGASSTAAPASLAMKAYVGAVGLIPAGDAKTTETLLCEQSVTANWQVPTTVTPNGTASPACAAGQSAVTK
ncbi:MAG: type IV pilin-like G/H family protein [Planktothrix sp. GU0601_MAG3]|nr:MAG: type IV pilin-like G/H family protein [Planktothrix sp. GU0601_MAG3]